MIIFTGRFQPFHNGHLSLIRYVQEKYPRETLCLAIVRNIPNNELTDFDKQASKALNNSRNLLTAEQTLYTIQKTLSCLEYKNVISTLIPRPSDETWPIIDSMFDSRRKWLFTCNVTEIDKWEEIKIDFYKSKGESVNIVPISKDISGTRIRRLLENIDEHYEELLEVLPETVLQCIKDYID